MILDGQAVNRNRLVSVVTDDLILKHKSHLANLAAQRQPTDVHLPTAKAKQTHKN